MSSSVWKSAVENYVKGKQENEIVYVATDILEEKLNLLQLVEELGPYLTSTEPNTRSSATKLLSDVLARLPADHLTEKEVQVLVSFYCDRLKDHHSVTPHVLSGFYAVSSFSKLPPGCAVRVVKEIFKEVQVQSLNQYDRRSVYNLLSNLLSLKLTELQSMGSDFVYGYIQVMDGERDPRNLLIAFHCVRTIVNNFPIKMFAEELFEVNSCYFPVDFNPSSKEEQSISKEELVLALRDTLSSSPLFAEFALPLIMEKLSSDVTSARQDSYDLLACAFSTYGMKCVLEFSRSVFSCVRRDVLAMTAEGLTCAALKALTSLVKLLSGDSVQLNSFLEEVMKECSKDMSVPGLKSIRPCGQLLSATASASDPACYTTLRKAVPLLMEQLQARTQALPQKIFLEVMLELIKISKDFTSSDVDSPLTDYRDPLFTLLQDTLNTDNAPLRTLAVTGLAGLISTPRLLSEEQVKSASNSLLQRALTDEDSNVRHEAAATLSYVSTSRSHYVVHDIVPQLLSRLNTVSMETEGSQYTADRSAVLHLLAALSLHDDIVQVVVPLYLDIMSSATSDTTSSDEPLTVCKCLCSIIQSNDTSTVYDYFTKTVLASLLSSTLSASAVIGQAMLTSPQCLQAVAEVFRHTVCRCNQQQSSNVLHIMDSVFLDNDTSSLREAQSTSSDLLNINCPPSSTQLVTVLMAVLCSLKKEVKVHRLGEYLQKLSPLAKQCTHKSFIEATKCIAGIVNKYCSSCSEVQTFLEDTTCVLRQSIESRDEDCERSCMLWFWLTKALVLQGHSLMNQYIDKILTLFEDEYFCTMAPDGIFIVMNEFDDIMTPSMHASIRLLYRQRFFLEALPRLIQGFHNSKISKKQLYLTAVSYLLRFIPKQVLLSELPPLVPVLVHSLMCDETSVQLSTVNSLYDLLFDAPSVLCEHLDSLVPQLLKLAQHPTSMHVRIASVQCIGAISTLPSHHIVPHTPTVLRQLAVALDDKKRLVRKEATKARNQWFMLETKK